MIGGTISLTISVWRRISKGRRQPVSSPTELQARQGLLLIQSFLILNHILNEEMAAKFDRKTHILSHSSPESAFYPPVFLFLSFFFIFCFLFLHGLKSDRGVSPTNRDVGRHP